jgi:hypothetical protein
MRGEIAIAFVAATILGTLGACLSMAFAMFAGLFVGAGHGTALPHYMFVAPLGFGRVVWPISFAMIGLPRKCLWPAFLVSVALIVVHGYGAYMTYLQHDSEHQYMEKLTRFSLFWIWAAMVGGLELLAPLAIAARLLYLRLKREQSSNS